MLISLLLALAFLALLGFLFLRLQARLLQGRHAQQVEAFISSKNASQLSGKQVLALCNPKGGQRTALAVFDDILQPMCKSLGINLDLVVTRHAGHAREIAKGVSADVALVICLSGDGMLHEVVQGLVSESRMRMPVAILPCGSSNGVCKSLYSSVDPFEVAKQILLGGPHDANLVSAEAVGEGLVTSDIMGLSHAVIMDVNEIVEVKLRWMNSLPFGAELKGIAAALFVIARMKTHRVVVKFLPSSLTEDDVETKHYTSPTADGTAFRSKLLPVKSPLGDENTWYAYEDDVIWCETMNLAWLAYDVQPSPGLKASDAFMDVIVSRGHSRLQLMTSFLKAEDGKHVEDPWFERYKVTKVVFESPASPFSMSGENIFFSPGKTVLAQCNDGKALLWY